MPTKEELEAMVRLCARTMQFLMGKEVDKNKMYNDEQTVWYFAQRTIEKRNDMRKLANEWNKNHPEAHRKHCREYARRKAERSKAK